jgi:hypothetical protein
MLSPKWKYDLNPTDSHRRWKQRDRLVRLLRQRYWNRLGHVNHGNPLVAAYFVRWTVGHPDQGANFDLILGKWGESTPAEDRYAVPVLYRNTEQGAGFMIVDAQDISVAESELAGSVLSREQVVGTELAQDVFEILGANWLEDRRIDEVRSF